MSAARAMAEYVADAFFSYEAMRDARDEALVRCCELEDQRDQGRRIAAALEAEVAKVRSLHRNSAGVCGECLDGNRQPKRWPCATAKAVYLP